jgi:hypothetical protein
MIDEESEYEDWIADAGTWLALADKCVMHGMYSLATGVYMCVYVCMYVYVYAYMYMCICVYG